MMKSEYAIERVRERLQDAGAVALQTLVDEAWRLTEDGDPRWIGVAMTHLSRRGDVEYLTCDNNHNHGASCAVRLVTA